MHSEYAYNKYVCVCTCTLTLTLTHTHAQQKQNSHDLLFTLSDLQTNLGYPPWASLPCRERTSTPLGPLRGYFRDMLAAPTLEGAEVMLQVGRTVSTPFCEVLALRSCSSQT